MGDGRMLLVAHLVLVAAYAGFQWTVSGLVYPQFDRVPADAFRAYERRHQQRVSRIVGPLFAGQVVTTTWLLVDRPDGALLTPVLVAAGCLALVLGATALFAVPLHRRLDAAWDPTSHRSLRLVDAVRTAAASAGVLAGVWLVLG